MKVLMKVSTSYVGKRYNSGKEYEIESSVGQRWARNGLAAIVEKEEVEEVEEVDFKTMTKKELYAYAKEAQLADFEKRNKQELIELLEEAYS